MKQILCFEAGFFECTYCGADNFVKLVPHVMRSEDLEAFLRESGRLGPSEQLASTSKAVFRNFPSYVRCEQCGTSYNPIPLPQSHLIEFDDDDDLRDKLT